MYKKGLIGLFILFLAITANSQTLFTYGKYPADAKDFLRMFNKNNAQPDSDRSKAIRNYLQLYINSRVKIQEAYDRGYDSLPAIKSEVSNLRLQIIENYLNDPTIAERLYKEAFQRSQKDIRVAHIFISLKDQRGLPIADAQKKKDEVVKRLAAGEDFKKLAAEFSDDPSAKSNKGDLGYITVFTLPYEFENIVYNTAVGKNSAVHTSKSGYHFFKVLSERKALGKVRAQQILLAIPPGSDDAAKKKIATRADSLYKKILAGSDFGKLATAFSNDVVSAANSGTMPDFGTGKYDPQFESVVVGLLKNGAVSKPFLTSHGWHIVKRISIQPIVSNPDDRINRQAIEEAIRNDDRSKISREIIAEKVKKKAGYQKFTYEDVYLWVLTDSILDGRPIGPGGNPVIEKTPLFRIGDTSIPASEFINYARAFRYKTDGSGLRPYDQVFNDFVQLVLTEYYREHLEDYNDDFRAQMSEFRDGNLFFEIMQREVWNKAQADSNALRELYEKNKKEYTWKQSADAVVFFCADQASGKAVYELMKKNPKDWRAIAEKNNEKVVADSSRFEWEQIPLPDKNAPRAGMITTPITNTTDNTVSFAYIIKVYPQPGQRSYDEAKGLLINDYQVRLELEWTEQLRKKYPVVVDEKVLKSIEK